MNGRRAFALGAWVGIAVLAVVAGALALFQLRTQGTSAVGGFAVADYQARAEVESSPAPDFELPSLEHGEPIRLSSFRGHVVVLNFWASWCAPCRLEAPGLRRVSERYRNRGVRFLGVNYRDDAAAAHAFVDEFRLGYPSVSDPSGSLAYDYELVGFPSTFIIDPAGTMRYRFVGYLDEAVLEDAVSDVLSRATS
jgi:cytochrome c biogenesis protein CcmG/thiol:disulfide interchange protein DsbE